MPLKRKLGLAIVVMSTVAMSVSCSPVFHFAHTPSGIDADSDLYFDSFMPSFCVSPDGHVFYFSAIYNRHRHIFRLEVATHHVVQVTNSDHGESFPSLSYDGKLLTYVKTVDFAARQAIVVRNLLAGKEWTAVPAAFGDAQFPRFSQNSKRIVYTRSDSQQANPNVRYLPNAVYICPVHGGKQVAIFRTRSVEITPTMFGIFV